MLRQLLAVTLTLGAALATPVTNPGPPGPADPKRCVPCPQAPRSESNAHPVVFASVLSLTGRCRRDGCACCAPQAHPVELALAVSHGHLLRQHPVSQPPERRAPQERATRGVPIAHPHAHGRTCRWRAGRPTAGNRSRVASRRAARGCAGTPTRCPTVTFAPRST